MRSYNGFSERQRREGERLINEAIDRGELPPKTDIVCKYCGQDEGLRHYHTEDYNRPVATAEGVCFRCHIILFHSAHRCPENKAAKARYQAEIQAGKVYRPLFYADFKALEAENGVK